MPPQFLLGSAEVESAGRQMNLAATEMRAAAATFSQSITEFETDMRIATSEIACSVERYRESMDQLKDMTTRLLNFAEKLNLPIGDITFAELVSKIDEWMRMRYGQR